MRSKISLHHSPPHRAPQHIPSSEGSLSFLDSEIMDCALPKPSRLVDCTAEVANMAGDFEAVRFASGSGLNISSVSWEDNARTKNSCWGPCISDMTLSVNGREMPLIKSTSNFNDETWDVEIEKIPLVIGNEDGTMLRTVTLKEYLQNFRDYLHAPSKWAGTKNSLLIEGQDKHVISSAQACFLPMPAEGEAKFNVAIRNYQARSGDPAVLAIVASANGTSAQVLDSSSMVHLHHNNKGQRASYIGQRLTDYRRETGSSLAAGAPMSASEKSQNMLLIIQVPLKQKEAPMRQSSFGGGLYPCPPMAVQSCCAPMPKMKAMRSRSVDVESAIVSIGADEGPFDEIKGLAIERDERFPIRVTMQYYKATSNGAVNAQVMEDIASELAGARKWAVAISSLVTETTDRTTEHKAKPPTVSAIITPAWWSAFWAQHATIYGTWTANAAHDKLFENGRFATSKIDDVREQVLDILGKGPDPVKPVKAAPQLPVWDV